MAEMPQIVAVVGAGTTGAGIAQLARRAGARTLLHDRDPAALARGLESVVAALESGALRGRWSEDDAAAAAERLEPATSLDQLAPAGLVIEAAPESLQLKQELLGRLSTTVAADCVLATNASSLPVTAVAAGATTPQRVVGLAALDPGGAAVGFHALPPLAPGTLVELTRGGDGDEPAGSDAAVDAADDAAEDEPT